MGSGADPSLSEDKLTKGEDDLLRTGVLTMKECAGDPAGPLSHQSDLLLNKITQSFYGGLSPAKMTAAALEMANLAGPKPAQGMMDAKNQDVPTPNFFSRAGYTGNPVTNGRTGSELLLQIKRIMSVSGWHAQLKQGRPIQNRARHVITTHRLDASTTDSFWHWCHRPCKLTRLHFSKGFVARHDRCIDLVRSMRR